MIGCVKRDGDSALREEGMIKLAYLDACAGIYIGTSMLGIGAP